jgi:hypothetical protein
MDEPNVVHYWTVAQLRQVTCLTFLVIGTEYIALNTGLVGCFCLVCDTSSQNKLTLSPTDTISHLKTQYFTTSCAGLLLRSGTPRNLLFLQYGARLLYVDISITRALLLPLAVTGD